VNPSAAQRNREAQWKRDRGQINLQSLSLEEQLSVLEDCTEPEFAQGQSPSVLLQRLSNSGFQVGLVDE